MSTLKKFYEEWIYWDTYDTAFADPDVDLFGNHPRIHMFYMRSTRWPRFAWDFICQLVEMALCWMFGHVWMDDSHFDGESGTECMECTRCGATWSHTYY